MNTEKISTDLNEIINNHLERKFKETAHHTERYFGKVFVTPEMFEDEELIKELRKFTTTYFKAARKKASVPKKYQYAKESAK